MTRRPNEEAVLFLLFGLLRSGQIKLRRIVGCQELKAGGEPAMLLTSSIKPTQPGDCWHYSLVPKFQFSLLHQGDPVIRAIVEFGGARTLGRPWLSVFERAPLSR